MIRKPEARPGFTLTEVLMAMFVMAIGMISLLALFPAGFLNARWALDTEQVSRGAANAQSMSEIPRVGVQPHPPGFMPVVMGTSQSVRNDDSYRPETGNGAMGWQVCANVAVTALPTIIGRDTFLKIPVTAPAPFGGTWTFNQNINVGPPVSITTALPILTNSQVRYPPVFVDPFIADLFVDTTTTRLPYHVGANDPTRLPFRMVATPEVSPAATFRPNWSLGIPRFSLSQYLRDSSAGPLTPALLQAVILRKQSEISMGDEIDFGRNGQPNINNNVPGQYASQRRFSWAYMCHWYDYATPEVCDVFTVVFNNRPDNGGIPLPPPGIVPGETTYSGLPAVSAAAGIESGTEIFGRIFVKGLNQAAIRLTSPEPMKAKVGDWILDSTLILPEFNDAFPGEKAPFLDRYHIDATYVVSTAPVRTLRPGLAGGHFYKILDISTVQQVGGVYFQTITLDRPAKSDGFSACMIAGIADVIVKGVGRMPQR